MSRLARAVVLLPALACKSPPHDVTVGAAISLKEVMDEVATTDANISMVYGASGDLASQMEHGAPFDVLAAAGDEPRFAPHADEQCTLAWNTLVLVKRRGSPTIAWATLDRTPSAFRLAIGLTPQVPAGAYAEQALRQLGIWDAVAPKTVRGTNVRNVLDLVARGEADAGIVYATDVKIRPEVEIVGEVPASARPNVHYPVYVAHNASARAVAVARSLCGDATKRVLVKHGFLDHPP
jgi:molybdate transport system substrate-binding protein